MEKKELKEALAEELKPVADEVKGAKTAADAAKTAAEAAKTTAETVKTEVDGLKEWKAKKDADDQKNQEAINKLVAKDARQDIETKGTFNDLLTKALGDNEVQLKALAT